MILGGIPTDNYDAVGMVNVIPVLRHCPSSERLSQSRYSRGVSNTCLVVNVAKPQASPEFSHQVAFFVVMGSPSKGTHAPQAIHSHRHGIISVSFKISYIRIDKQFCNPFQCESPLYYFPPRAILSPPEDSGRPHALRPFLGKSSGRPFILEHGLRQALVGNLEKGLSFATEGTPVDWMIRVSLGIHYRASIGGNDEPASACAVAADAGGLCPYLWPYIRIGLGRLDNIKERACYEKTCCSTRNLQEISSGYIHFKNPPFFSLVKIP